MTSEEKDESQPQTPEQIASLLKLRVLSGQYRAGQRLIEMDLAEELHVGRGRIREAFRLLIGEGYLLALANRGVQIRRYSRAEMVAMGRTREMLEGLSARLAAERTLEEAERAKLEDLQLAMNAAEKRRDTESFAEYNHAYHTLICEMSQNVHLLEFTERVRVTLVRLQLPRSFAEDALSRSNRDHRVITTAILSGTPDAAEAAMRAHVRAGNAHIQSLPDSAFE
ncbi:MAG: GntR family transcriptional regulator [Roseinatronobacter sp.]